MDNEIASIRGEFFLSGANHALNRFIDYCFIFQINKNMLPNKIDYACFRFLCHGSWVIYDYPDINNLTILLLFYVIRLKKIKDSRN